MVLLVTEIVRSVQFSKA